MQFISILSLPMLFILMIQQADCSENYQHRFADCPVTINDNFNEKYPELSQGFSCIQKDFQSFMLNQLVGKNPHEIIDTSKNHSISRLDDAIFQAENHIINYIDEPFGNALFNAIKNNTDLHIITVPVFLYTIKSPLTQPHLKKYIENYTNNIGETAFLSAVKNGNKQITEFLLELDVDINAIKQHSGQTALHLAVVHNKKNIIPLLLKNEYITIDAIDENFTTPLEQAIDGKNLNIVQLLIQAGANVNREGRENWTPLHHAATNNSLEIAKYLLQHGADKDVYNSKNKTPYQLATSHTMKNLLSNKKRKHCEEKTLTKID